jgi:glucuronokinase
MELIRKKAFARAGLIGNPSDGYHGKTISIGLGNLWAQVSLYEWEQVEIVWSQEDRSRFDSIEQLADDVVLHGYYGGVRLVKATIKLFVDYCRRENIKLHDRNFSVRYESNIPRQVGLAGSSAIIIATFRCLMEFYDIQIPLEVQPSLALAVEREELGIGAGLQDRVSQVYQGAVFMDFGEEKMREKQGFACGHYEPLDVEQFPPLYVAYSTNESEPTEVVHNDLRTRYEQGDADVIAAMQQFAQITVAARAAIAEGDVMGFGKLVDDNFNLRRSICNVASGQENMVRRAREAGATAKFAGSGGAIIGTLPEEATFARLEETLTPIGCKVIRPVFVPSLA